MNHDTSRRQFLATTGASLMAGALGLSSSACSSSSAQQAAAAAQAPGGRLLLKGGCVLTLDAKLGDFDRADVLIEGSRIVDVKPVIDVTASTIDASNMIVMPGFVDTHRHMWQGALRNILPNGLLSDYSRDITGAARTVFRPEDARVGDLVTALGALNAGVTTVLDWSHIGNSPEHTDAAIAGLREAGLRAVYAFGAGSGSAVRHPDDIRRLRKQQVPTSDPLLTLALAAGLDPSSWQVAREVGARISVHVNGALSVPESAMGPDVTYIHCTQLDPSAWKRIAATGGHVSIACPIEMEMGHGIPPIQESLDHGIRPSLSVDVETQMPGDFFTQMRAVFTLQRMQALARARAANGDAPTLLTTREVIEFATIAGARANGLDSRIGTLTPGKEADVILLRRDLINVLPFNNAYGAVVQAMDTSNVDTVLVAGRVKKRGGQLVGVDLARIRQAAEASRDYIVAKAGWSRSVLGRERPGH